jgi:hypothetical protein
VWEWRPRLYRWALVFRSIGVVVTLFGTAVVPVWRPIAHQIIFGGIGPLHITVLFLWLRLGAMLMSGGWRDSVKLGLFLVPIGGVSHLHRPHVGVADKNPESRLAS